MYLAVILVPRCEISAQLQILKGFRLHMRLLRRINLRAISKMYGLNWDRVSEMQMARPVRVSQRANRLSFMPNEWLS